MRAWALMTMAATASGAAIEGEWTLGRAPYETRYKLTLRRPVIVDPERTLLIGLGQLTGVTAAHVDFPSTLAGVRFTVARDAGTIVCTGSIGLGTGKGRFRFEPDVVFVEELRAVAADWWNHEKLYEMAMAPVPLAHIRNARARGFYTPYAFDLIRWHTLGSPPNVPARLADRHAPRAYRETGYLLTREEIERFQVHGVTPDLLRQLRSSGYDSLSVSDTLKLQTFGVTQYDIQTLDARGYRNLNADDIVRLKNSPEFPSTLPPAAPPQ